MHLKLNRNIIKESMKYQNDSNGTKAASLKLVDDYENDRTAYNPLFGDSGKIVAFPEDYLYSNSRHNLKDFIIIDGKKIKNDDYALIGFLCTSKNNKKTTVLKGGKLNTDIIAVQKIIIDKNKYKKAIKKSRSLKSKRTIQSEQVNEIKKISTNKNNIEKSKKFKNKKEA